MMLTKYFELLISFNLSYAFMVWCLMKHRDNFAFTILKDVSTFVGFHV